VSRTTDGLKAVLDLVDRLDRVKAKAAMLCN
jgi:hypothetical protein